jgi:iron complex transport system permease protein
VLTVLCAFAAAMACAAVVLGLASVRSVSPVVLVLAGVGLTYLFAALTASVQFVASEQQLAAIVHWTFGSLNGRTWNEVAVAGAAWLLVLPVLLLQASALNALAGGGDDVARTLGFNVPRVRMSVTLAAVFSAAAIVSFTGVIGFVGLVAPHIARLLIGGDHRWLLPFSAVGPSAGFARRCAPATAWSRCRRRGVSWPCSTVSPARPTCGSSSTASWLSCPSRT